MDCILEIQKLSKKYHDFALEDINLCIPKGCIMGFIGENGAGKTTTIKAILQLIRMDEGSIKVFGKDMRNNEKENKEWIGTVFSESSFPDNMNLKQIDKVMLNIYKNWDSSIFNMYAEQFKLPLNKPNKQYSRGMKMKLQIAIALSHHAKLLLLDEATSGLDPIVRDEILDILLDFIQDEEKSVFISSHITSDIEKCCDYVTFIHQGEILLSEEKDELLEHYGILKTTPEAFANLDKKDYAGYRKSKYALDVLVKDRAYILQIMPDAVIDSASLEDIMLYTIKGGH